MKLKKRKWSIRILTRLRDARLKKLRQMKPFLAGSLVKIARTCGNPRCKCARGQKHSSYYLTHKHKGKTKTLYVPVDLEKEVQKWVSEYAKIKGLMREVSHLQRLIVRRHVEEKRRRQRAKKS